MLSSVHGRTEAGSQLTPVHSSHKHVLAYFTWSTPALWHGLRAYANEANWVLVAPNHVHTAHSQELERKFDGVLALMGEYEIFDLRKSFPDAKIVDLQDTRGLAADAHITVDHQAVGRMAADYLHDLGYRKFLGLRLNVSIHTLELRLGGFSARLHELGFQTGWMAYDLWMPSPDKLLAKVRKMVHQAGFPLAVFAPDDNMADLFLQAVLELGLRVPEDVAVLASNNDRGLCEWCRVPLSSVNVNFLRLGYESARLLDRLMENKNNVSYFKVPPLMVAGRSSTERPESHDLLVSSILDYIREHFAERITADIILRDIRASRTVAYERFRKVTGHSIGKEIERIRMQRAQSLLTETDYKVDAIARLCGYMDTSAFCRAYRLFFGETPSQFRFKSAPGTALVPEKAG